MFTAKVQKKETTSGTFKVFVEFSDGETSTIEWCIPQNKEGLNHWIKSRLETLNAGIEIDAELNVGDALTGEEVVEEPVPTPEEEARNTWLIKWHEYSNALRGMKALEEAGITPTSEETTAFEELKTWVADNRKPEYTHFI